MPRRENDYFPKGEWMALNKRIGRFEILRELGRGAQSIVYLALDPHLQRQVAIKTLHFARADAQQNRQLLDEARMVSQLRHPNIVPIFEADEEEGDLYLVFEYVPGRNLAELIKKGALTADKALPLLRGVLEAIAHAHTAGIIHRDLKPSNILLDEKGVPRVMDFGIAARAANAAEDGKQLSGTPAYMAPEYITRRVSNEQSDVFSVGLIFYELLAGQRAVSGSDIHQMMQKIASADITLPAVLADALDDKLKHLLHRALARQPANRFASATQMRQALDDYLQPEKTVELADAQQSTIEFLLRRMRHKSDFPALSESVGAVNLHYGRYDAKHLRRRQYHPQGLFADQQIAARGQFGALPAGRWRRYQHRLAGGGRSRAGRGAQHRHHGDALRSFTEQVLGQSAQGRVSARQSGRRAGP